MEQKRVRLIYQEGSSNKFYEMEEVGDGSFNVSYGRIGANPVKSSYGMYKWQSKYNEKIKKGYVDVSETIQKKMSLDDIFANFDLLEQVFNK